MKLNERLGILKAIEEEAVQTLAEPWDVSWGGDAVDHEEHSDIEEQDESDPETQFEEGRYGRKRLRKL